MLFADGVEKVPAGTLGPFSRNNNSIATRVSNHRCVTKASAIGNCEQNLFSDFSNTIGAKLTLADVSI
jgi:hypothetical protein